MQNILIGEVELLWSDCGHSMTTSRKIIILLLWRVMGCFHGVWHWTRGYFIGRNSALLTLPRSPKWTQIRLSQAEPWWQPDPHLLYSGNWLLLCWKPLLFIALKSLSIFFYYQCGQGLWSSKFKPSIFELVKERMFWALLVTVYIFLTYDVIICFSGTVCECSVLHSSLHSP